MRFTLLFGLLAIALLAAPVPRPDPKLTPGAAAMNDVKAICATKWGKDERHVTEKMKREVCAEYHARNCPGKGWEIDHLVSRELGGADDVKNLWPQPAPSFHQKDVLENFLHRQVCAAPPKMTLEAARACLVDDWWACYQKYYGK